MPTPPPFDKPVTPIEKFYIAIDRLFGPFVNQLVIHGEGDVAAEQLRDASRRAAEANPGVTLRHERRLARMRWVPGPAPRFSTHHAPDWRARSGAGAPFLDAPLDPEQGPSCELQRITTDEGPCLVFRSLHATMDGGGTRHWAEEVLRALRGEPLLGSDNYETDKDFAAGLNKEPFRLPKEDAVSPLGPWDESAPPTRRWQRITIDTPRTDNVLARIALVLAANAHRHNTVGAKDHVRINIPADLRFFRPDVRSTGNLIGAVFEELTPDEEIAVVAERVKQRLRAKEHARFPFLYDVLRWVPLRRMCGVLRDGAQRVHRRNLAQFSATVSYLGTFPTEPFSTPTFDARTAFFIPPVAQQGCFVTGTHMRGKLELLVAMQERLASRGRGDELTAALREALTAD